METQIEELRLAGKISDSEWMDLGKCPDCINGVTSCICLECLRLGRCWVCNGTGRM